MPLRRHAVALVITATVLLVSCGVDRSGDPPASTTPPTDQTVLLVGVDDNKRADSIMLVHVGVDGTGAGVSLPRDLQVRGPDRIGKLNAVYTTGGITPLIEAVRTLTGVRADHYAIVEMASFAELSDAVGGVRVCLREATTDGRSGASFPAGEQEISGERALAFLRQRHGLPRGDLDRVVRQQAFLRALAGTLRDANLPALLKVVRERVETDPEWDVLGFAEQVRGLRADQLQLATVPIADAASTTPDGGTAMIADPEADEFVTDLFAGKPAGGDAPPSGKVPCVA